MSGLIVRTKIGNRWRYLVESLDHYQRARPSRLACRKCLSVNTFKRRFVAIDGQEPHRLAVRQCRDCGVIRVVAR